MCIVLIVRREELVCVCVHVDSNLWVGGKEGETIRDKGKAALIHLIR